MSLTSLDAKKCPVCGTPTEGKISLCAKCGFSYANVRFFGGEQSKQLWEQLVFEKRIEYRKKEREQMAYADHFILAWDRVAFVSSKDHKLYLLDGEGNLTQDDHVLMYSRNERNTVTLYENGTTRCSGDNGFGQCDLAGIENIKFVTCAPNAIYGITREGEVAVNGHCEWPAVREWGRMQSLAAEGSQVVGLTVEHQVKAAGKMFASSVLEKVSGWNHVKEIVVANDCCLALFEDGTVSFAGKENDPRREAEKWENVVTLKADSSYIVGLTTDGHVLMSGKCNAFLDMGRSAAVQWENVMAIATSKSGIAAILGDGTLEIAGNFSGDAEKVKQTWEKQMKGVVL